MPDGQHGTPVFPGDSGTGVKSRGIDQLSLATCARVRGPARSPHIFGDSGPVRGPLVASRSPGRQRPVPKAQGVNQMPRATLAWLRGPAGWTRCPGTLALESEGTRCPLGLLGDSDRARGPGIRTAVPGDSRLGPRYPGIHLLSWATRAGARGPAVSTYSPGRLGFWSEVPQSTSYPGRIGRCPERTCARPVFPGHSDPGPRDYGVDLLSWANRAGSEGQHGRPAVPVHSGRGLTARGVDQSSRATHARFRRPAVRPDVPGDSGPGRRDRDVDQLSRVTRARV